MESKNILEIFQKLLEYEEIVNEATVTSVSGSYRGPLSPGLKLWDKNTLEPFTVPLQKFNNTQIIAPEFIFIKNFKTIELSSIVIHTGGAHYVCVFKYNDDNWYYYNDNPGGKRPIVTLLGNYKAMIKKSPYNPFTNGTLFFYKSNSLKDLSEELSEEVSQEVQEDE
jgi:hypothetical protein